MLKIDFDKLTEDEFQKIIKNYKNYFYKGYTNKNKPYFTYYWYKDKSRILYTLPITKEIELDFYFKNKIVVCFLSRKLDENNSEYFSIKNIFDLIENFNIYDDSFTCDKKDFFKIIELLKRYRKLQILC